jgi:hypothetical protein
MTETKPKRRWFRFSLRTLFVLVTVVGVVAGWVAYQLNWIRQRHIFFSKYVIAWTSTSIPSDRPLQPWQLRLFGEKDKGIVNLTVDNSRVAQARALFPELFITGR